MTTRACFLLLFLLASAPAAHAATCAFDATSARFETLLAQAGLPGGALLLGNREGVLLERYFGTYDATTVVPIASATKLLSAVRIVQLAEQGRIDLEAPVSQYLPQFGGDKASMSVGQMFSHTSGYGGDSGSPLVLNRYMTLAEAVDLVACCVPIPNGWFPGGQFAYGGISMHVAGRVAEVVGGDDWQAQWLAHVGTPLGTTTIDYEAFGETSNYGIAGTARSNLRDYGRILHALANDGWSNGVRLLHPGSVTRLLTDRVGALPVASAPANAVPPVRYGLGHWIDGELHHSLGAFGYFPFLDTSRDVFGVFMIRGEGGVNDVALAAYLEMIGLLRAELDTQACQPGEYFPGIAGDGFEAPAVDLAPD